MGRRLGWSQGQTLTLCQAASKGHVSVSAILFFLHSTMYVGPMSGIELPMTSTIPIL